MTPDDPRLPENLRTGLLKLGLALRTQAWKHAGEQRLTPTQSEILNFLAPRSETGARLSSIAEAMAVSSATASEAAGTLVKKGLVEKSHDQTDSRAICLRLTPEGHTAAENIAHWSDFLLGPLGDLTPDEQLVFYRGLLKLIRGLQQSGAIPLARMCVTCKYFRANAHPGAEAPHHCDYVDAAFGERFLRLDCNEHQAADPDRSASNWSALHATWQNPGSTETPRPGS